MRTRVIAAVFAGCLAVLFARPAEADLLTDPGFFDNPTVVDFSEGGFPPFGAFGSATVGGATFSTPDFPSTGLIVRNSTGDAELGTVNLDGLGSGTIRVDFANAVNRVGFDYDTGSGLFLEAYDAQGSLLNQGMTGPAEDAGFAGFDSGGAEIAWVLIKGDPGMVFIDDFRYELGVARAVPEPAAILLLGGGLIFVGLVSGRFGRKQRVKV